jgi:hypothetical protein
MKIVVVQLLTSNPNRIMDNFQIGISAIAYAFKESAMVIEGISRHRGQVMKPPVMACTILAPDT